MMLMSTSFIIFYFAVISACWAFVAMYCYTRRDGGGGYSIGRIQQKFIMKAISARIILIIFVALLCGWTFLLLKICRMDHVLLQSNIIHTSSSNVAAASAGRRRGRLRKGSNGGNQDLLQMEPQLSSPRLKKRVTSCRKQRLPTDQTVDLCMKYNSITKHATHLFLYNPTNRDKFICGNLIIGPGMSKVSRSSIDRLSSLRSNTHNFSLSQPIPITPTIVEHLQRYDQCDVKCIVETHRTLVVLEKKVKASS